MNRRAATSLLSFLACGLLLGACGGSGGEEPEGLSLTRVSPSTGPAEGGTNIMLDGTGFTADATVLVGGAPATDFIFLRPAEIWCVTPPGPYGAKVDVTVITPAGT